MRAFGSTVAGFGTQFNLQPYHSHASVVFVCRRTPLDIDKQEVRQILSDLLRQDMRVKWTECTPTNGDADPNASLMSVFELDAPKNVYGVALRLIDSTYEGRGPGPRIQYNVWMDETSCGICHGSHHRIVDCTRLVPV